MFKDNMSKSQWIQWGSVNKLREIAAVTMHVLSSLSRGRLRTDIWRDMELSPLHLWWWSTCDSSPKHQSSRSRVVAVRGEDWGGDTLHLIRHCNRKQRVVFDFALHFIFLKSPQEAKDLMRTNELAFRLLTKGINNKFVPMKQICPMLLNDDYHCCIVLWFLKWALNLCAATTPLYAIHILFSLLTKMTTYCMSMTPVAGIDESQWNLL